MQRVTRATSIAAVAVVTTSMLMQTASAVEVTNQSGPAETSAPAAPPTELELPPPSSPNCFILGSRSFSIPFSVDTAGTRPVEVHLLVCRGPNQDWQLLDRKRPDVPQKQFQFEADSDGEFWFATRTIDTLGRSHPAGEIESQLKVYVDTTKPQVNFQAEADADGRIDVTVSIHDATELKEVQLRYVTDTSKKWVNVELDKLTPEGQLHFYPADADTWKQISVQLVVTDTPGNQNAVNHLLRRPRLADADTNRFAGLPDRTGTEALALPYRMNSNDEVSAYTVSNPVIKLDRHQSRPPSQVTTAHGYAPDASSQRTTPFYGFRGASAPIPPAIAMQPGTPAPFSPAPATPPPQSLGYQSSGYPSPTTPLPPSDTTVAHSGSAPSTVSTYSVPDVAIGDSTSGTLPQHGVIPQLGGRPSTPAPAATAPTGIPYGRSDSSVPSYAAPQAATRPTDGSYPASGPASSPLGAATSPLGADAAASGTATPRPASLFDKLFGTAPAPGYPTAYPTAPNPNVTGQAVPPGQPNGMTFGPPSIRGGQVRSRLAASGKEGLPPPATPEEISQGFELNSPSLNGPTSPSFGPSTAGGAANGPQPETIPLPSNPERSNPANGNNDSGPAPPQRPRPKTPAEAMRPIDEPSEVSSLLQEEVPTPTGQPDAYRSRRPYPSPTPTPGGSGRSVVANMMDRAPVRYSDSQRFSLEYELEAVGIQGVEAIELYGSTDGGSTWELWGRDPDRTSPFDIEVKEAGLFGFRIVVLGRNGLASPRPLAGESPDIMVVVDTERPNVRITGARYGEGDRVGALVIQYECDDAHLKERPIALSFSESMEGPWTTIAAGLSNEGQYIWMADPHLPRQLYLRIDATDQAGNTGTYVLDQPIDSQGLAPRAKIRGFQSISGDNLPFSEAGQTAIRPQGSFK